MRLVTAADAVPSITQMVMHNAGLWKSKRLEQPLSPPAIGRLMSIHCPVLVVVGAEDQPHILDIAHIIVDGVPGATLTTIPGAAHLVNLDTPRAFNDVVARFLAAPTIRFDTTSR